MVELLVVISIIGILSSVLLASLATARQKSRDGKRISDMDQMRIALELYFDKMDTYPSTTVAAASRAGGADGGIVAVFNHKFLPQVPVIPSGVMSETTYIYRGVTGVADCTGPAAKFCPKYILGTNLERTDNVVLISDVDDTVGTVFYGDRPDCLSSAAGAERCYAMKP